MFFAKGLLFRAKTFSMIFDVSMGGVRLVGFKVDPKRVLYTFHFKADDILCKGVTLPCKEFLHDV